LEHSTSPFCDEFFWDRVSQTICPSWLQTSILPISSVRPPWSFYMLQTWSDITTTNSPSSRIKLCPSAGAWSMWDSSWVLDEHRQNVLCILPPADQTAQILYILCPAPGAIWLLAFAAFGSKREQGWGENLWNATWESQQNPISPRCSLPFLSSPRQWL
jgi:hypothetical protein